MSLGDFLSIQPSELKFPFELRKQSSCSMQLANKTDQFIAFKVKTTNPKKYCVRPNAGIVLPNSFGNVTVILTAQKEAPPDMQCRDKFLIQSVIAPHGATNKDVTQEMFNRENGKVVDEFRLRVVYIHANPPSPVPEGDEEGTEDEIRISPLSEGVTSLVAKMNEEIAFAVKQNEKLVEELELIQKQTRQGRGCKGVSIVVVIFGLLLGILVGYFIR